jgi:FtsZ-binding cell division protein ZapB
MEYYGEDEYYPCYEPTVVDEILNEYQEKMKDALLDTVKLDIANTKYENTKLKEENKTLKEREHEVNQKERQLEIEKKNLMLKVRNERLAELMKDFEVVMYKVRTTIEKLPKCNNCDDNRKIHFKSPLGNDMSESCLCDKGKTIYIPMEFICTEFRINSNNKEMSMWYKMNRGSDYDYYSYESSDYAETVYNNDMKYEDLKSYYHIYFKSINECQKYCDWLNKTKTEK